MGFGVLVMRARSQPASRRAFKQVIPYPTSGTSGMDNLGICMSNFDRDAKPETRESGHFYQPVTVRVLRANPNMIEFTFPQSGQGGRWLCVLYNTDPKDLVITPPLPG